MTNQPNISLTEERSTFWDDKLQVLRTVPAERIFAVLHGWDINHLPFKSPLTLDDLHIILDYIEREELNEPFYEALVPAARRGLVEEASKAKRLHQGVGDLVGKLEAIQRQLAAEHKRWDDLEPAIRRVVDTGDDLRISSEQFELVISPYVAHKGNGEAPAAEPGQHIDLFKENLHHDQTALQKAISELEQSFGQLTQENAALRAQLSAATHQASRIHDQSRSITNSIILPNPGANKLICLQSDLYVELRDLYRTKGLPYVLIGMCAGLILWALFTIIGGDTFVFAPNGIFKAAPLIVLALFAAAAVIAAVHLRLTFRRIQDIDYRVNYAHDTLRPERQRSGFSARARKRSGAAGAHVPRDPQDDGEA
jgi:hypothetical protein